MRLRRPRGRGGKLIRAGGVGTLLHQIFQRTGRFPSEVMRLPPGERAFCLESMRVTLEAERT